MKTTRSQLKPENIQSRRQFLGLLGRAVGRVVTLTVLPGLTACHQFEPKPFMTGDVVKAPLGCQELLQRDQRGDC